jgi:hypothetical protein
MYDVRWSQRNDLPLEMGQTVSWMRNQFKIEEIRNRQSKILDFTQYGGFRTELTVADLTVTAITEISEDDDSLIRRIRPYVSPL